MTFSEPTPLDGAPSKGGSPTRQKARARDIRRLALQALFVIDATGNTRAKDLLEALEEPHDFGFDPVPRGTDPQAGRPDEDALEAARLQGVELAIAAWYQRDAADQAIVDRTPEWPTHRQPPIDRTILRLALFEIRTGRNDPRVVINEAVELAKAFGTEQSPAFINGVLDKLQHLAPERPRDPDGNPVSPMTGDVWLDDAIAAPSIVHERDEDAEDHDPAEHAGDLNVAADADDADDLSGADRGTV